MKQPTQMAWRANIILLLLMLSWCYTVSLAFWVCVVSICELTMASDLEGLILIRAASHSAADQSGVGGHGLMKPTGSPQRPDPEVTKPDILNTMAAPRNSVQKSYEQNLWPKVESNPDRKRPGPKTGQTGSGRPKSGGLTPHNPQWPC